MSTDHDAAARDELKHGELQPVLPGEGGSDYATVAMRYAIVDATVDRATGRSGHRHHDVADR